MFIVVDHANDQHVSNTSGWVKLLILCIVRASKVNICGGLIWAGHWPAKGLDILKYPLGLMVVLRAKCYMRLIQNVPGAIRFTITGKDRQRRHTRSLGQLAGSEGLWDGYSEPGMVNGVPVGPRRLHYFKCNCCLHSSQCASKNSIVKNGVQKSYDYFHTLETLGHH